MLPVIWDVLCMRIWKKNCWQYTWHIVHFFWYPCGITNLHSNFSLCSDNTYSFPFCCYSCVLILFIDRWQHTFSHSCLLGGVEQWVAFVDHTAFSSLHNEEVLEFVESVNLLLYLVSYMDINFAVDVNKDLQTPSLAEECELVMRHVWPLPDLHKSCLILWDGMVWADWFLMYTGDSFAHCGMISFVLHLESFGEVLPSLGRDLDDEAKA
jgi:hypothetical protein